MQTTYDGVSIDATFLLRIRFKNSSATSPSTFSYFTKIDLCQEAGRIRKEDSGEDRLLVR